MSSFLALLRGRVAVVRVLDAAQGFLSRLPRTGESARVPGADVLVHGDPGVVLDGDLVVVVAAELRRSVSGDEDERPARETSVETLVGAMTGATDLSAGTIRRAWFPGHSQVMRKQSQMGEKPHDPDSPRPADPSTDPISADLTITLLVMVVLGGVGTLIGPLLGGELSGGNSWFVAERGDCNGWFVAERGDWRLVAAGRRGALG